MSQLHYKCEDTNDPLTYFFIPENGFVMDKRNLWVNFVEEFDIIKKIKANEEGFFDFSKSMIDIGAEDGNYALLLPFTHNYCFEPNKKACCLLYTNMYLRDKVDITDVYIMGLDCCEGEIKFNGFTPITDDMDLSRIYIHDDTKPQTINNIQVSTLDSFHFKNIGFIKVDVEGFEERVLRGSITTIISNNYPPILFECWEPGEWNMTTKKRDNLFHFLEDLGYTIFKNWGDHETHLAVHKTQLEK